MALSKRSENRATWTGFTFAAKYDPCNVLLPKEAICLPSIAARSESERGECRRNPERQLARTDRPELAAERTAHTTQTSCQPSAPKPTPPASSNSLTRRLSNLSVLPQQETLHPDLKGVASGAHAKSDPRTGDVYNYNLDFGRTGTYRIFRSSASTGKTFILATFTHAPAYLHSIFLTENYVILCVWNSSYKAGGASIPLDTQPPRPP